MFEFKTYEEKAFTPELGGEFEGLQLEVRYYSAEDQSKRFAASIDPVKGTFDYQLFALTAIPTALELVTGWKGTKTEYSEELKNKALAKMMLVKTEQENGPGECFNLKDFIIDFASKGDNFLLPSANT